MSSPYQPPATAPQEIVSQAVPGLFWKGYAIVYALLVAIAIASNVASGLSPLYVARDIAAVVGVLGLVGCVRRVRVITQAFWEYVWLAQALVMLAPIGAKLSRFDFQQMGPWQLSLVIGMNTLSVLPLVPQFVALYRYRKAACWAEPNPR